MNDALKTRKMNFIKLPFAKKKEMVFAIVNSLRKQNKALDDLYATLSRVRIVPQAFLEKIYFDVIDFAEDIRNNNTTKNERHMNDIHDIIEKLHQREKEENDKENADLLLNDL